MNALSSQKWMWTVHLNRSNNRIQDRKQQSGIKVFERYILNEFKEFQLFPCIYIQNLNEFGWFFFCHTESEQRLYTHEYRWRGFLGRCIPHHDDDGTRFTWILFSCDWNQSKIRFISESIFPPHLFFIIRHSLFKTIKNFKHCVWHRSLWAFFLCW